MGNLRIIESLSRFYVAEELKHIAIDPIAIKEMGEPFFWTSGQKWIFAYDNGMMIGFICYKELTILYLYVMPEHRGKGVATELYNELPAQSWRTVASNVSLHFFTSRGFQIIKSYVKCHKLWKK